MPKYPPVMNKTSPVDLSGEITVHVRRVSALTISRITEHVAGLTGPDNGVELGIAIVKYAIADIDGLEVSRERTLYGFVLKDETLDQITEKCGFDWIARVVAVATPDIMSDELGKPETSPDGSSSAGVTSETSPAGSEASSKQEEVDPAQAATEHTAETASSAKDSDT